MFRQNSFQDPKKIKWIEKYVTNIIGVWKTIGVWLIPTTTLTSLRFYISKKDDE